MYLSYLGLFLYTLKNPYVTMKMEKRRTYGRDYDNQYHIME